MKIIMLAALAAAIGAPVSLGAQANNQTIIVQEDLAVAEWSSKMSSRLARNLEWLPPSREGTAIVRFRCSDEGRPTAVELHQKSGSINLDRVAMRSVSNLKSMHPLPSGIGKGQVYEAAIIVAATQHDIDREIERLHQARADAGTDPQVLAFVVASAPRRGL